MTHHFEVSSQCPLKKITWRLGESVYETISDTSHFPSEVMSMNRTNPELESGTWSRCGVGSRFCKTLSSGWVVCKLWSCCHELKYSLWLQWKILCHLASGTPSEPQLAAVQYLLLAWSHSLRSAATHDTAHNAERHSIGWEGGIGRPHFLERAG